MTARKILWLCDQNHLQHPFIRLAAKTLHDTGHSLTVIDRAPAATPGNGYRHIALRLDRTKAYLGRFSLPGSVRLKIWILWPLMLLLGLREKPSIVIVDLPTTGMLGWLISRVFGARLVYFPFELFGEQSVPAPASWKRWERRLLQEGIHAFITQNPQRAEVYVRERGCRVEPAIVHNYKARSTVTRNGKLRDLLELPSEARVVLYEGHLMDGRWLDKVVESVSFLPEKVILVFLGKETPWWKTRILPKLQHEPSKSRVRVGPWIPHHELLEYVADADAGIVIYDDRCRNNFLCEPGKLSDYVMAGVPVVAPRFPSIAPVIEEHGIGACFEEYSPAGIAKAIGQIFSVPQKQWQEALAQARETLAWETQVPAFLRATLGE